MDGPISTYEAAGPAQRASCTPFRKASVGPPEKVPPVSEGNRPRASDRDEAGLAGKVNRNPEPRDRKAETGGPTETQALPLPGESSPPAPHEVLSEALAAARARWAEVNHEALDPTDPLGKDSSHTEKSHGLRRQLTLQYENLATSLSNPHPTRPIIDLFV